jgi:cytochrome c556
LSRTTPVANGGRGQEPDAATSRGGDVPATLATFAALGKEGCGGCHETFRKKED